MIQSINNIALTGVNAENSSVDVTDGSVMAYRVSTDTSSQITGNKTIAFTGVPSESLTVLNFIIEGGLNTSGASKLIIGGVTIPDLFAAKKSIVFFEYVNSAWVVHYSMSAEQTRSIDGSALVDDSVPAVKLENDIAGSGMTRNGSGGLDIQLESVNPSMQIVAGELGGKLNPAGAIVSGANGMEVSLESVNPTLKIAANELGLNFPTDGGFEATASGTKIKVDAVGDLVVTTDGIKFGACVCIKSVVINVTSAEVLDLNSNPKELLPAPGANKYIDIISATVRVNFNSNVYTTNTELGILSGSAILYSSDCLSTALARIYKFDQVPLSGVTANQISVNYPISLYVDNGNPVAGNSTLTINILYRIVDVS